ncbi:hypothetical protein LMG28688_02736 [Paraburkholderia caffeinitolerans]|uniref:Phenol hydroxylase P0 protein n=1 Tax=Paraburkholderia caffeinitolerans TaxID=1723730 RepID=A0A6J5FXK7_9BURK|nr:MULTISPECIES: phenol hydroxylase subunit [Paraburkholderia]CAB3788679.1 hypothetical protein LMG28688_02736 [Paraburkholderia caffeinitolerans]
MAARQAAGHHGPSFDVTRRFIRPLRVRPDGFIEFSYSAGDPELSVELILPVHAFREFCAQQGVEVVLPSPAPLVAAPH